MNPLLLPFIMIRAKRNKFEEFIPYKNSVYIRGEFQISKNDFLFQQDYLRDLTSGVIQDEIIVAIWMSDFNQELISIRLKYRFYGSRIDSLELKTKFEYEDVKSEYIDFIDISHFHQNGESFTVHYNFRLYEEYIYRDI